MQVAAAYRQKTGLKDARGAVHKVAAYLALKAGDRIPVFTLSDPDGKPVSSAELLAKGPLVISFYRGVW